MAFRGTFACSPTYLVTKGRWVTSAYLEVSLGDIAPFLNSNDKSSRLCHLCAPFLTTFLLPRSAPSPPAWWITLIIKTSQFYDVYMPILTRRGIVLCVCTAYLNEIRYHVLLDFLYHIYESTKLLPAAAAHSAPWLFAISHWTHRIQPFACECSSTLQFSFLLQCLSSQHFPHASVCAWARISSGTHRKADNSELLGFCIIAGGARCSLSMPYTKRLGL